MKVYRLEDMYGNGPFYGDQKAALQLAQHKDPETMLKGAGINKKNFKKLCRLRWVFGWKSKELYDKFFHRGEDGKVICREIGFELREYEVSKFIVFEDGQVMFKRGDEKC